MKSAIRYFVGAVVAAVLGGVCLASGFLRAQVAEPVEPDAGREPSHEGALRVAYIAATSNGPGELGVRGLGFHAPEG